MVGEQSRFDAVARLRETQYPGRIGVDNAEQLPVTTVPSGKHLTEFDPTLLLGRGTDERVAGVRQRELDLDRGLWSRWNGIYLLITHSRPSKIRLVDDNNDQGTGGATRLLLSPVGSYLVIGVLLF